MKICVINGTEKRGVTQRLKDGFLEAFQGRAEIVQYDLPRDCPGFCSGCMRCIAEGEAACKDAEWVRRIERSMLEADLIVMTSPTYVFHATGAMKALLDHFAYRWMPHRPAPEMFTKRALILTQCLGAGARSAARDLRHSLCWWGVSSIGVFTAALMGGATWEELSEERRAKLMRRVKKLSQKFARIDCARPARASLPTKIRFLACRRMQQALRRRHPESLDARHWAAQGWLGGNRPWRATK